MGPEQSRTGPEEAKYGPSEAQYGPAALSNGYLDLSNTSPWWPWTGSGYRVRTAEVTVTLFGKWYSGHYLPGENQAIEPRRP